MEWNETTAAALEAALEDTLLTEKIAEAKDAGEIRALLAEKGVDLSDAAADSAFTVLERIRADGLHEDDIRFASGSCRDLAEDGVGAYISILARIKYRRCFC